VARNFHCQRASVGAAEDTMMRRGPIHYAIHLQAESGSSTHNLRAALKALRRLGLRCTHVTETLSSPNGARRRASKKERQEFKYAMDMRKFSGERFIKLADVADGPINERIVDVREGRYAKPDLIFESGDILSLNSTNNAALMRAYGSDSDGWKGKDVELYHGQIDYEGKPQDAVRVKPISPPITVAQKAAATKKLGAEMDDEIPY
jgi:hypothetical protein